MASIRQLTKPNREGKYPWVVEYTDPSGKRRRATPPSGLQKDATALRRQIEREIEDGKHKPRSETTTFGAAAAAFVLDCERRNKIGDRMAGGTLHTLTRDIRVHLVPAFGAMKLTDIRTATVQDWVNAFIMKYARGTVLKVYQHAYQILEFAVAKEWLTVHPLVSHRVRIPNKPARKRGIPSVEEMQSILAHLVAPKRAKQHHEQVWLRMLAVTLNLLTGMRRGEVCGLQWENVDLDGRMIHVRHSFSDFDGLKSPKTEAGVRTIPMSPPVWSLLNEWREKQGGAPTGFVILRLSHPLSPKVLSKWFWELMHDMKMVDDEGRTRYSLHTLRHCAVSLLLKDGLPMMHVKRTIGHNSFKTTMDVYGHLLPGDDSARRSIDNIAGRFDPITPQLQHFAASAPRGHAEAYRRVLDQRKVVRREVRETKRRAKTMVSKAARDKNATSLEIT